MGFYFQDDFWETVCELPDDLKKEAIASLVEYYFTGEEPEISGIASMPYKAFRGRIDLARKQSNNAKKPRKKAEISQTEDQDQPDSCQDLAKEQPNDSQTIAKYEPKNSQTLESSDQNKRENKNKKTKVLKELSNESSKKSRFIPPSPQEVSDYSQSRGHPINGESFCSYYESNGWKVGRNPMKDWQAAVRTWIQRDSEPKKGGEHSGEINEYASMFSIPVA